MLIYVTNEFYKHINTILSLEFIYFFRIQTIQNIFRNIQIFQFDWHQSCRQKNHLHSIHLQKRLNINQLNTKKHNNQQRHRLSP